MQTRNRTIRAFTLVEVLTTVAIIGILLAVLVPALNQVGKTALVVKQKAQFHTIEMALEAFRSDRGQYPPSAWNAARYGTYSASQRLAEAIIGRDGFGFHPASRYHWDGRGNAAQDLYAPVVNPQTNLTERKGPYLELESANAVQLGQYSTNYGTLVNSALPSFVLADVFKTAKLTTGRKTGMPILYYIADRTKTGHRSDTITSNTYDAFDSLGEVGTSGGIARLSPSDALSFVNWFYLRTKNPNFSVQGAERPYRAESFILHSAGPDGRFGTVDDLFNFDEGK